MRRWWWLAVGVGAYLAFTLYSFPAATAYAWFAPEVVRLGGIEGTLWSGSAAAGSVAGLGVHDVRWRVHPAALLIGRLSSDVAARLADGFVQARVSATPSRVELADLTASTSLPTLRAVLPLAGVRGSVGADLARLRIEDGWVAAIEGELKLADLEVPPFVPTSQGQLVPLGGYAIRFEDAADGRIAASFNDTGGPLEVGGTLTLDAQREYSIDGRVKPRAGAPPELVQGVEIMTDEPDAEGRRRLTLMGSL